jgi:hypothetical protein
VRVVWLVEPCVVDGAMLCVYTCMPAQPYVVMQAGSSAGAVGSRARYCSLRPRIVWLDAHGRVILGMACMRCRVVKGHYRWQRAFANGC